MPAPRRQAQPNGCWHESARRRKIENKWLGVLPKWLSVLPDGLSVLPCPVPIRGFEFTAQGGTEKTCLCARVLVDGNHVFVGENRQHFLLRHRRQRGRCRYAVTPLPLRGLRTSSCIYSPRHVAAGVLV